MISSNRARKRANAYLQHGHKRFEGNKVYCDSLSHQSTELALEGSCLYHVFDYDYVWQAQV